jgi:DNA-binding MarR family transcriptional regulator
VQAVKNTPEIPPIAQDLLNCTCINLRTAARVMTRLYDDGLAPSGIRITQLATLAAVAYFGPFTVNALADALVMDRTTLTADLKPLEKKGWLKVVPGQDRRQRIISITEQGRLALEHAIPMWVQTQQKVKTAFGEARLGGFLSDLQEVVALGKP